MKEKQKELNYRQVADIGHGLLIVEIPTDKLREQDINARMMQPEMYRQLVENIKKRGQLESLPFCALRGDTVEIISGHHRIRAAKDAGMKSIVIILDVSGLNRSQVAAKQLAHNAIAGYDDKSTLKEIAKLISDVDDMIESYVGKDIIEEPQGMLDKILAPKVEFDWRTLTFTFLPHQIEDLEALMKALEANPEYVGYADISQYKEFLETLSKYQKFDNVKNVGAAIHAMVKCADRQMRDVGYEEDGEFVQLSTIFTSGTVRKEYTDVIKEALTKMEKDGIIDGKRKWEALAIWAADYLDRNRE